MTIVLIGYMGSGKSRIGAHLSELLNYNYLDFDSYLEEKTNSSINEIFKSKGELYFRRLEAKYLSELLQQDQTVIALGGGTPCYGNNISQITSATNVKSVYLKTSIPVLSSRLLGELSKRPLISHLKTEEDLQEFIGKHLFERSIFYRAADIIIETDKKSVEELGDEISSKLL